MGTRTKQKWTSQLRAFDFFPKAPEEVRERASAGAAVTIVGATLMVLLAVFEIATHTQVVTQDTIFVDTTREQTLWLHFDLVFFELACRDVTPDIVDNFGEMQRGRKEIEKRDVDAEQYIKQVTSFWAIPNYNGNQAKGCRVFGRAEVQKTRGNLHIAAGSTTRQPHGNHQHHVHHITPTQVASFNVSHFIVQLSFEVAQVNHVIQLVPTIYEEWSGETTEGYQYSAQTSLKYLVPGATTFPLPGVFFKWDISPFVIKYQETGRSFAHLMTRLCAVTGGTFVVIGLVYGALSRVFPVLRTVGFASRARQH